MMRKVFFLIILMLLIIDVSAQKITFGMGVGVDMLMNLQESNKYKRNNSTSNLMNMNAFFKFHFKKGFNICPIINFNIIKSYASYRNVSGKFMPEGSIVYLPYSTPETGWEVYYYSKEHYAEKCNAYYHQYSGGLILSKDFGKKFEVGSGIFINYRKVEITDIYAIDKYMWQSSTGTLTDNYRYIETSEFIDDSGKINYLESALISVPLFLQYNYELKNMFYLGINFTTYIGLDMFFNVGINISTDLFNKE